MRLQDFYVKNSAFVNDEPKLEISSLMGLFDRDFIQLYENEMQAHFDFLKSSGISGIKCSLCKERIDEPRNLIRYFGANIHRECFTDYYNLDKEKLREQERIFFDRVYSLIVLGIREKLF